MPFLPVIWSFLSGTAGKLLTLAARVPWWAWLAAAALFIGWRVHSGMEDRAFNAAFNKGWAVQEKRLDQWKAAYAINMASIAELQADLKAKNDESDARGAALTASKAQDAQSVAAADQRLRATTSQIAQLRGIADHASANPTCKVPDELAGKAEGL